MKMGCLVSASMTRAERVFRKVSMRWPVLPRFPTQYFGLGRNTSDFGYFRPLCWWCGIQSRIDRLYIDDKRNVVYVPYRAGCCKTVTGEDVNAEQLGGASVHTTKSGVAHFAVDTEEDGLKLIRNLLSFIPQNNLEEAPIILAMTRWIVWRILSTKLFPISPNKAYDMYEVIGAIVDKGEFL